MLHIDHTPTDDTPFAPLFLSAQGRTAGGGGVGDEEELAAIRAKRLRILIVDDEPAFRGGMSFWLAEKYDAEVADLGSGPEAIEALRAGRAFDLVIIDVMMSPLNGFDTYRELKSVDPSCQAAMMSANAGNEKFQEEARGLGGELFPKPIPEQTMTRLLARVGRRQS